MRSNSHSNILLFILIFSASIIFASDSVTVTTESSCAVEGYTAEQAQQLALKRARKNAIEMASGVKVDSTQTVTDGSLALESIRSSSRGYIVEEKMVWKDITQYRKTPFSAPIPEYNLELTATVKPITLKSYFNLTLDMNKKNYLNGDSAALSLTSTDSIEIALFYYGSDDVFYKFIPNEDESIKVIPPHMQYVFPEPDSEFELVLTSDEYDEIHEAMVVVAIPKKWGIHLKDVFMQDQYSYTGFFQSMSEISDEAIVKFLPYTVHKN